VPLVLFGAASATALLQLDENEYHWEEGDDYLMINVNNFLG